MTDWVSTYTMMNVLLLAAGVVIGLVAGYLAFPAIREAKRLRVELDRTLQEQESYKASVNSHFRKTAELVGEMTRSYAAVYDHLATGARNFCDEAGDPQLPFAPLPGALASPVIETAAVEEPAAEAPPADTATGDTVDPLHPGHPLHPSDDGSDASLDSASATTTSEAEAAREDEPASRAS
jgi:uncharacterized membrane-anchored protein YhcB (DUF1043 family)